MCALPSCGGGSTIESTTSATTTSATTTSSTASAASVSATLVSSNHGMGNLEDIALATLGSDLYALVSTKTGANYVLSLYKSSNGGASWVNQNQTPALASLTGYAMVSDGTYLYLSGGRTSVSEASYNDYTFNKNIYRYSATGGWSVVSNGSFYTDADGDPGGRQYAAMTSTASGKLYLHGGYRVSSAPGYDTKVGSTYSDLYVSEDRGSTWTALSSTSGITLERHCMGSANANHYLIGGRYTSSGTVTNVQSISIYDGVKGSWTKAVSGTNFVDLPAHTTCTSIGNKVVIVGGTSSQTLAGQASLASNKVHIMTAENTGSTTLNLSAAVSGFTGRYGHGATALNGKVIVVGGMSASGTKLLDVLSLAIP